MNGYERIAFLGPRATFTEQALLTLPESVAAELVPCAGNPAVLAAVRAGKAEAGLVPIENSVEGAVGAVLDGLVLDPPLVIVREVLLPVRFALMARAGTARGDIRTVGSHPHGLAQTREWIAANLPAAEVVLTTSTAEAAAQVARGELDAATAAPLAATQHELEILVDDVADNPGAVTRFVLVAPPAPPAAPTGNDRTTVVATLHNRPGTLTELLTELAVRGIDLTRIESRPIKDRHAEYWFHIDCTGHVAEPAMGEALAALRRRCDRVRFLGSFPQAQPVPAPGPTVTPDRLLSNAAFLESQTWLERLRTGTSS